MDIYIDIGVQGPNFGLHFCILQISSSLQLPRSADWTRVCKSHFLLFYPIVLLLILGVQVPYSAVWLVLKSFSQVDIHIGMERKK